MSKQIICMNPQGKCLIHNCENCSWGKEVVSPVKMIETIQDKRKEPKTSSIGGKFVVAEKRGIFTVRKTIWITRVEYNAPWTIVFWNDDTITRSQCAANDTYTKEAGLAICILKRLADTRAVISTFENWCGEKNHINLSDVRKSIRKRK